MSPLESILRERLEHARAALENGDAMNAAFHLEIIERACRSVEAGRQELADPQALVPLLDACRSAATTLEAHLRQELARISQASAAQRSYGEAR